MVDNVTTQDTDLATLPSGTTYAFDLIGGVYYQRVKVTWGADGVSNDASAASPLPVDGSGVTQPGKIAYQTTKALTQASVSISSSGDNTVVAGTAAQTVRVFRLVLVAAAPVNVTIKDGASTSLTGAIPLNAGGNIVVDDSAGEPEFITSSGNSFVVNLSAAVSVVGWVGYTKS